MHTHARTHTLTPLRQKDGEVRRAGREEGGGGRGMNIGCGDDASSLEGQVHVDSNVHGGGGGGG